MITKTVNLYSYNELSEEAKEKARDWYRQGNEYHFLSEAMSQHLMDLFVDYKILATLDDVKIFYSLSYCQGDGAMFEGNIEWRHYKVKIKHSGHYYHYNSKDYSIYTIKTDKEASEKVYAEFEKVYVAISKELARYGYSYIEAEDSEENVAENIEANEYTFTKDGKRED